MPLVADTQQAAIPIVIGVTGHRDLVDVQIDDVYRSIARLFADLRARFPATPLRLMSSLAEGADRVAARAALEAGIAVQAVLPMQASSYREDFATDASKADFDNLRKCCDVVEMPVAARQAAAGNDERARSMAYAEAGMFISAHCHILLAIWDGEPSDKLGGTAQIVYFQHYDRLPGIAENVPRTSLFLTDDESDLVYHVRCARRGNAGSTSPKPVTAEWFTADTANPRTDMLPERYVQIFERTDEFNRDIERWQSGGKPFIDALGAPPDTPSKPAAAIVARYFGVADTLANGFQRLVSLSLRLIYVLAVLTALAFILYSELSGFDEMIYVFLGLLLLGSLTAGLAGRRHWHRKYLEYRVLAEGLRVQYYWTVAGIHGDSHSKFAYDNFLRQRDMQLGWIRNVMRIAGVPGDAHRNGVDPQGLRYTVDHWIGTQDGGGQLAYYRHKASFRHKANVLTERLSRACLWVGILIAAALAFRDAGFADVTKNQLIVLMGILPLIAGVAEAYTQRKATRELSKQYRFMARVFGNARRRIDEANSDNERREVLLGLGEAALTEHAEWILTHREREPGSTQL